MVRRFDQQIARSGQGRYAAFGHALHQAGHQVHIGTADQLQVDTWTGVVRVQDMVMCTALGPVASAQGSLGQMEGGAVIGLAMCTQEDLQCVDGHYTTHNLDGYLIPTMADAPRMQVLAIENLPKDDPIGPRGAGEISVNFALPAVANALATALQHPVTHIPMTPARVIAALESSQELVTP